MPPQNRAPRRGPCQNRAHWLGGNPCGHPRRRAAPRRRHDAQRSKGAAGLSERWAAAGRGAPGDCHLLPPPPAAAQAAVAACGRGRCRLERCGRRAAAEASRAEPLHVRHPARVRQRRAASQTGAAGPHKTTPGLNSPTWVVTRLWLRAAIYLPCISPTSPRNLAYISPAAPGRHSRAPGPAPQPARRLALHHRQPGASRQPVWLMIPSCEDAPATGGATLRVLERTRAHLRQAG